MHKIDATIENPDSIGVFAVFMVKKVKGRMTDENGLFYPSREERTLEQPNKHHQAHEKYKLGNVFQPIDTEKTNKFFDYSIYQNSNCHDCWIRHLCGGECYHNFF